MLTIHHLENSRSHRVVWLLEELGLQYEIHRHRRDAESSFAGPDLWAAHPLGKAPVLCDGTATFAESGAILEHLVEAYGHGRLAPAPGTPERARYRYWMHAAEGSVMPLLVMKLLFARVEARAPLLARPFARAISRRVDETYITPNIGAIVDFMEAELSRSTWFAGNEFSAADVQMGYVIEAAEARGVIHDKHTRLRAFIDRSRSRPAYRAAIEKGGPFQLLAA